MAGVRLLHLLAGGRTAGVERHDRRRPQVSTVAPASNDTFGRDPNNLTNAPGRLPNDRPHVLRVMGSVDVPRTGSWSPRTCSTSAASRGRRRRRCRCRRASQRILLEPRGSRRLSSQSLLDLRVSRTFAFGGVGTLELLLDVLNALNDTAEEASRPTICSARISARRTRFVDPRRAMVSVDSA